MKKIFYVIFALVFAVSCGSSQKKSSGPSKVDTLFVNSAPGSFSGGKKFLQPAPWAVGQYVILGNIEKGEKKSVAKFSIVGKADGGYIFEIINTTEKEETAIQYLIKGIDKVMKTGNSDDIEFAWIKVKGKDGKIQVFEGAMLSFAKMFTSSVTTNMKTKTTFTDGGTVTVPAGTFSGVNLIESESKTMGFSSKSKGYYHPSVPIYGIVKSVTDDDSHETVLIGFGMSGAKATIPLN
jgi:hypothetical protein